jgi:hypothetical protein
MVNGHARLTDTIISKNRVFCEKSSPISWYQRTVSPRRSGNLGQRDGAIFISLAR